MRIKFEEKLEKLFEWINIGNLEEAIDYIEKLPSEERNSWEIDNIMGIISSYCGEYESAISFFKNALKKNSDSVNLYYNLADTYMNVGKYEQTELMIKCCEHLLNDENMQIELTKLSDELENIYKEKGTIKEKNKVLMIPYYYPPLSGSGVFRSVKFVKYISEMGWEPTVISTDVPPKGWEYKDESLMKEIPKDIDVIRVPDYISSHRENSISKENVKELVEYLYHILKNDIEAIKIFDTIMKSQGGINRIVSFPCCCLKWSYDVIKYIEANMDINSFDVIYTTSGPHSSHLIGSYFKNKYGVPWVADYRDAWTFNPYGDNNILSNINVRFLFRLESILLKQADCNITYADSMISEYTKKFDVEYDRISSITNGYDEIDFKNITMNKKKTKRFTLNYSGLLYSKQRSIEPVLVAINQLISENKINKEKICFRVVGEGNEQFNQSILKKYNLNSIFEQTGYVTHKEALEANINSDMLLLLVGDEEKFKSVFTGKVFEYLRSGKPILALAPRDGEVDRMLKITGHGEVYQSYNIQSIKDMILREYNDWMNRKENVFIKSPYIRCYDRKYLTMKLAAIFNDVKIDKSLYELDMDNTDDKVLA